MYSNHVPSEARVESNHTGISTNTENYQALDLLADYKKYVKQASDEKFLPQFIDCGEKESESPEIKAFNEAWTKSSKALEKTPLEPLVSELGKQLASGKLDPEALQKVLKDIKLPADDLDGLSAKFRQLREGLQKDYGLDVEIGWLGKGEQVMPGSLTIKEANGAHQDNAQIRVGLTDKPEAKIVFTEGYAGNIVKSSTADGVMTKVHEHITRKSKQQ
ncbi:MAG: hypothetical protein C0469_12100 [Cyanobacteria bacterium DS2.3.42]|nr:hypothetical protein [Cyanobacteria bacterium DS2.3.42]